MGTRRITVVAVAVVVGASLFLYASYQPPPTEENGETGDVHHPINVDQVLDAVLNPLVKATGGMIVFIPLLPGIMFLAVLLLSIPMYLLYASVAGLFLSINENEDGWYHYTGAFLFSTAYPSLGILLTFPNSAGAELVVYFVVVGVASVHTVLSGVMTGGATWKSTPIIYTCVLVTTTVGLLI